MQYFTNEIVKNTVNKLIKGQDYREEVVNSITTTFFDFCLEFFKKVLDAKIKSQQLNLDWYKENFISEDLPKEEFVINAGLNRKTIKNIYGTEEKKIAIDVSRTNYEYIKQLVDDIGTGEINIKISLTYNNIHVDLDLQESLIVINALATKKVAIRGGAWSSIGKKVEKPLIDKLCEISKVPAKYIDNKNFKKDKTKDVDREIDYKLFSRSGKMYRIEVKLMGRGNPESADVVIARDTAILVADTLSQQNKNQCKQLNVEYVELKGNNNIKQDFEAVLQRLDIPFNVSK